MVESRAASFPTCRVGYRVCESWREGNRGADHDHNYEVVFARSLLSNTVYRVEIRKVSVATSSTYYAIAWNPFVAGCRMTRDAAKFIGPFSAIALISACIACSSAENLASDAATIDTSETEPMCHANENGTRSCFCDGGAGPSFTLACDPSSSACFVYPTTCVDTGFERCSTESTGDLRAKCHAFCEAYAGADFSCSGI